MDRRLFILGSLASLGWGSAASAEGDQEILVFVNPKVRIGDLSADDLEAIFTTRKKTWSGGGRIVPFNFPAKNPVRVAFDRAVLHMDPDEVARYWIDRRVRGGARPPRRVPSARLMVKVVAKLGRSIGYARASDVPDTVRTIGRIKNGKLRLE